MDNKIEGKKHMVFVNHINNAPSMHCWHTTRTKGIETNLIDIECHKSCKFSHNFTYPSTTVWQTLYLLKVFFDRKQTTFFHCYVRTNCNNSFLVSTASMRIMHSKCHLLHTYARRKSNNILHLQWPLNARSSLLRIFDWTVGFFRYTFISRCV